MTMEHVQLLYFGLNLLIGRGSGRRSFSAFNDPCQTNLGEPYMIQT